MPPRARRAHDVPATPPLAALRSSLVSHADAERRRRGEEYFRDGSVRDVTRRGDEVTAKVQGSRIEPYRVSLHLAASGVAEAACTCPYDAGGWCKHIVATVLALVEDSDRMEHRPRLEELLASQDREALVGLIERLAEGDPDLVDLVEAHLQVREAVQGGPGRAKGAGKAPAVNPRAYRRRVQAAIHSLDRLRQSEAYWQVPGVVDALRGILGEARGLLEAGDAENALAVLEALTDEYVADWTVLDGSDGGTGAFYSDLGPVWTEALLAARLSAPQREALARKLEDWQGEVDDYGIEPVFEPAIEAARHGWDAPSLRGPASATREGGTDEDGPPADLAHAGVEVLWRQGRRDEALALAERTGQPAAGVAMLAELGRAREAVAHGMVRMTGPEQALAGSQALLRAGARREALQLGGWGLRLGSSDRERAPLAGWLRDVAVEGGKRKLALRAAEAAFRGDPTHQAFTAAKRIAGRAWPAIREGLLVHLAADRGVWPTERVAILLEERLWAEAMAAADADGGYDTVEPVVDAVLRSHPEWAIKASMSQAERIMDSGDSARYHHAVRWLGKCRNAHRAAGRGEAWRAYHRALIEKHRRKHKLRGMLEGLAA